MAYENYSSSWEAKESHKLVFSKNEVPTAEKNYALCMVRISAHLLLRIPLLLTTVAILDISG